MTKRPSNMLLKGVIAVAAILGIFILGSWLIQIRKNTDESNNITVDVTQANFISSPFHLT